MMDKHTPPIRKEYLEEFYKKIRKKLDAGKNVKVSGISGSGKSAYMKYLALHPDSGYYRELFDKTEFIYVDTYKTEDNLFLWATIAQQLFNCKTVESEAVLLSKISKELQILTRQEKRKLVIIFDNLYKFTALSDNHIENLKKLREISSHNITFIFIDTMGRKSNHNIYDELISQMQPQDVELPRFRKNDLEYILNRLKTQYNIGPENPSDDYLTNLFNLASNNMKLVRALIEVEEEYITSLDVDKLLENPIVSSTLKSIFDSFNVSLLSKLKHAIYEPILEQVEITDSKARIKSPLVSKFVKNFESKALLTSSMTPQETEVFNILLDNKGSIISRDEIARRIWGEDYAEKYSDWSLDSIVSRLRKKQSQYVIKSVKGKGIVIKNRE